MAALRTRNIVLAAVVGSVSLAAGVLLSDSVDDQPDAEDATVINDETNTIRPVPVLDPELPGTAISTSIGAIAITSYPPEARDVVLSTWGVGIGSVVDLRPDGTTDPAAPPAELTPEIVFVDDPRLSAASVVQFVDPCVTAPDDSECPPPDESSPAEVQPQFRSAIGPNAATVLAFPHDDVQSAAECRFADLRDGEIPIAVITANPGTVRLDVGGDTYEIETDSTQAEAHADLLTSGQAPTPADLMHHCIAVPRPAGEGAVRIVATAVDGAGQVARAETTLLPGPPDRLAPSATPIDGTLLRVDVPLPDGVDADVSVHEPPVAQGEFTAQACTATQPRPSAGWRRGTSQLLEPAPSDPSDTRSYLEGSPLIRRATVALPEGEASLVCVEYDDGTPPASFFAVPPDGRRVEIAVDEVVLDDPVDAGQVQIRGIFAELGWSPCHVELGPLTSGPHTIGPEGELCRSEGDTGALRAAGSLLDLQVQNGNAVHRARIVVDPDASEDEARFRLPLPAIDQVSTLCTPGADVGECVAPDGDAVAGDVVVVVRWSDGPIGPAEWVFL